jgi:hypothetical protein
MRLPVSDTSSASFWRQLHSSISQTSDWALLYVSCARRSRPGRESRRRLETHSCELGPFDSPRNVGRCVALHPTRGYWLAS